MSLYKEHKKGVDNWKRFSSKEPMAASHIKEAYEDRLRSRLKKSSPVHKALERKKEDRVKSYDSKHGINAYHHRYTKSGRAQSKAYDNYFGLNR